MMAALFADVVGFVTEIVERHDRALERHLAQILVCRSRRARRSPFCDRAPWSERIDRLRRLRPIGNGQDCAFAFRQPRSDIYRSISVLGLRTKCEPRELIRKRNESFIER